MISSRGFWLRWSWRDLRRRWLQVVATSLVIAVGTGLYAGLGGMREWRERSNDLSFAQLAYHDLRVDLSQGSYLRSGSLRAVVRGVPGVRATEERMVVPTQIDASHGGRTVLVPGQIVGMPVRAGGPRVDTLAPKAGRTLRPGDARAQVVVLDRAFADHYGLPAAGRVRLAGLGPTRYVGQALSPQYFLVSGTGSFGGEATFAVVYAPLRVAQRAAARPGRVNEAVLRLAPGANVRRAERDVRSALDRALPGIGATVTRGTEEPAYRVLYKDARSDQRLLDVFAYLVLGGAALAAFNLISRVVESERREIGVGMALGVPPRALALRPVLMGVQIALLGVALGIATGVAFAGWLSDVFREQLPLPSYATAFRTDVFLRAAALGFLLPLAATAYPVWRGVRVPPIEAIRIGFHAAKGGGFAPLLKRIRLPGSSLAQMPLRNVVRAPRRTIMTMLGLAAVITTVVSLSGMFDSFAATVDGIERETLHQGANRLDVRLDGYHPRESRVVRRIERAPGVGAAEPGLRVDGELRSGGRSIDVSVALLDARSAVWTPTVEKGGLRAGQRGVVIARKAAADLGVGVGDEITLRHPVRRGSAFDLVDTRAAGDRHSPESTASVRVHGPQPGGAARARGPSERADRGPRARSLRAEGPALSVRAARGRVRATRGGGDQGGQAGRAGVHRGHHSHGDRGPFPGAADGVQLDQHLGRRAPPRVRDPVRLRRAGALGPSHRDGRERLRGRARDADRHRRRGRGRELDDERPPGRHAARSRRGRHPRPRLDRDRRRRRASVRWRWRRC